MKINKFCIVLISGFVLQLVSGCEVQTDISGKNIENSPELIIGCDEFAPYSYRDNKNNMAGIDVELAREACRRLGYKPVFRKIRWEEKDKLLEEGEVACLWGCFSMNGRKQKYLWAGPYLHSRQVVMVHKDSQIEDLSQLADENVTVQAGGKAEEYFLAKEEVETRNVYAFSTMSEAMAAIWDPSVGAVAGHEGALLQFMKEQPDAYRFLDRELFAVELGVAFKKKGNKILARALTATLSEMIQDGTTGCIVKKYGLDPDKML